MSLQLEREQRWQELVAQIQAEYQQLAPREKSWIRTACARIESLQNQLDQLFRSGDGLAQCRTCRGDCCALGHNHLTLANLLLFLTQEIELPVLDFSSTCPLLGARGCQLSAARRPYNCISFLCDRIEDQLQKTEVEQFYRLEKELRTLYHSFASRYAGGGMSGLLVVAQRLQGRAYLERKNL